MVVACWVRTAGGFAVNHLYFCQQSLKPIEMTEALSICTASTLNGKYKVQKRKHCHLRSEKPFYNSQRKSVKDFYTSVWMYAWRAGRYQNKIIECENYNWTVLLEWLVQHLLYIHVKRFSNHAPSTFLA